MHQLPLLRELTIAAIVGVCVALALRRIRIPTIPALLTAGALLGPFGFHLIRDIETIELLAEIGVIFLLFSVGLEFSLSRLKHIVRQVVLGGSVQVLITTALVLSGAILLGETINRAVFGGFVVSMSSTAIVLRLLAERAEIDAPHGRFIVGVLIFQDLCIIPMMLIVPILAKTSNGSVSLGLLLALSKAALVVMITFLVGRLVLPKFFSRVDATRSHEIFLLAMLGICLGTAWLTSLTGLSLALGAFLAGLMLADTDFRHRALTDLLPLRDTFSSIFFISLGMLFDLRVLWHHPLAVISFLLVFTLGKSFAASISALVMRFPPRAIWLAGFGLAQFGEFGFVLLRSALDLGLISEAESQITLAAGILSMFLTPLLITIAPRLTAGEKLLSPLARIMGSRTIDEAQLTKQGLAGHVVLVGYGAAGRLLTESLIKTQTPLVILEMNATTVREAQQQQIPIYYADATSSEVLQHAELTKAKALVIMINDREAARRIVDTAKRLAPQVPIFIRTRYKADYAELASLGAADIICEEFEAGLEMINRVLCHLHVAPEELASIISQARCASENRGVNK